MQRTPRLRLGFNPGVSGAGSLIRDVRHYAHAPEDGRLCLHGCRVSFIVRLHDEHSDSRRPPSQADRRGSLGQLFVAAAYSSGRHRDVTDSDSGLHFIRQRGATASCHSERLEYEYEGLSMWPNKTLDRMTRSAVSRVFQCERPWRAPRHRSALRSTASVDAGQE